MAGDFALLLLGTVSRGSGPFWRLAFCLLSLWDNCGSTPQNVDMFLVGCTLGLHPFTSSVHFVLAKSVPSFGFSLMSVEDLMCGPCYRVLQLAVQDSGNLFACLKYTCWPGSCLGHVRLRGADPFLLARLPLPVFILFHVVAGAMGICLSII